MPLSKSQRAARTVQSEIRVMSIECEKVGGINLAQGVCDTEVPDVVREGAKQAVDGGINSYTRAEGITELRSAIAEKMRKWNGIECDPETEVIVHSGSTGAFYAVCLALLDPGDEVILFEPYYGYHLNTLAAVEATPVFVTLHAPDWKFDWDDMEKALTPRTKAVLLNTPANPSGKVFTRHELEWIADFARQHDLFVFTDEIYEYFIFDGQHVSIATFPGMKERTITMSGYSKTFSITGWRIGYTICDRKWTQSIAYFHDLVYVCAPAPLQAAVAKGIRELPETFYKQIAQDYVRKRDLLCNTLKEVGLTPSVPDGAYYVLADASDLPGNTSKEKAMSLLEQTGVAAVAGSAFYHADGGENLLRFCFAKTDSELEEACERLRRLAKKTEPAAVASNGRVSHVPPSFHVVVEGQDGAYWLHVAVRTDTSLEQLDTFLRETWLECCSHLSAFIIEGRRYTSRPMGDLGEGGVNVLAGQVLKSGSKFFYEYDFGTTTELTLNVVAMLEPQEQQKPVQLLARNEAPKIVCENCGGSTPATVVCSNCSWKGYGWLCEMCMVSHECGVETFLPVVNSPRVGVCAYGGHVHQAK